MSIRRNHYLEQRGHQWYYERRVPTRYKEVDSRRRVKVALLTVRTAQNLLAQFEADEEKTRTLGRATDSAMRVLTELKRRPIANVRLLAEWSGLTHPTVRSSLNRLIDVGIVTQPGEGKRDRVYVYSPVLEILEQGTEPL